MKTKNILIVAAITLAAGFAAPARAGISVNISFGVPVRFQPPVVVAPPPCAPPVVMRPPVIVTPPPCVVVRPEPPPHRPVVYVTPRYDRHERNHDRDRDRGWGGHDRDRGHDWGNGPRGGRR